ncbi:hypothetical protein SAMN02745121_06534 [Nannocystis exedens]|uniref:Uncharacterized protein n=1 Tax=Nannocystis exedens TaxID=54 RepID=A0A1I2FAQ9_9BACT|nr:hypothetical protein [Nannocystis exedens]PCC73004.1 hypothetical protein NAEX_06090 [Nannocystis exedens]SFF01620.1 hypothetical protein SAMN02745121_06534 [Nannocystis exedens]
MSNPAFSIAPSIERLSDWLAPIQQIFVRRGYPQTYLGGSSAREILDAILFDEPLALRDIDLYLVRGGGAGDLRSLCLDIEQEGHARVGRLREKRRANPDLPGDACYQHVVGEGAHLYAKGRPILSLGVLHRRGDLALNGLFDVDTTFLCLDNHRRLADYALLAARYRDDPGGLHVAGLILDPHHGYLAWRDKAPTIVHWQEVARCPAQQAFRMVRTLAKASRHRVPPDLLLGYQRIRRASGRDDAHELDQSFLKILGDTYWTEELGMLAELDTLSSLSAPLSELMCSHPPEALRRRVPELSTVSPRRLACTRIEGLLRLLATPSARELRARLLAVVPFVFGPED